MKGRGSYSGSSFFTEYFAFLKFLVELTLRSILQDQINSRLGIYTKDKIPVELTNLNDRQLSKEASDTVLFLIPQLEMEPAELITASYHAFEYPTRGLKS